MSRIDDINSEYLKKKVQCDIIRTNYDDTLENLENLQDKLCDIEISQKVLQSTAKNLQNRLSIKINEFVTYTLDYVFGNKVYDFHMEFVEKRGKTEVEMYLTTEDGRVDLNDLNNVRGGGGVLDVVAFALRIALWTLQTKKSNVFIFDQPFQNVSADVLPRLANLISDLSERLNLQIIAVNHLPNFRDEKFNIIEIEKQNGISSVVDKR